MKTTNTIKKYVAEAAERWLIHPLQSTFKHSQEEKDLLKGYKAIYKKAMKAAYGNNIKRNLNPTHSPIAGTYLKATF